MFNTVTTQCGFFFAINAQCSLISHSPLWRFDLWCSGERRSFHLFRNFSKIHWKKSLRFQKSPFLSLIFLYFWKNHLTSFVNVFCNVAIKRRGRIYYELGHHLFSTLCWFCCCTLPKIYGVLLLKLEPTLSTFLPHFFEEKNNCHI